MSTQSASSLQRPNVRGSPDVNRHQERRKFRAIPESRAFNAPSAAVTRTYRPQNTQPSRHSGLQEQLQSLAARIGELESNYDLLEKECETKSNTHALVIAALLTGTQGLGKLLKKVLPEGADQQSLASALMEVEGLSAEHERWPEPERLPITPDPRL